MTAITELATHGHERPHARSQAVVAGRVRASAGSSESDPDVIVPPAGSHASYSYVSRLGFGRRDFTFWGAR